jgi:polysaccharide biosynthesis transport protein
MELIRYVRVLQRFLWMIIICPILAAGAAAIVSVGLPSIYEAQAVLLVRPAQPLASTDPTVAALSADQISSTYASLMKERPLLESVIADLGLKTRPDALAQSIKVTPEPNTTLLDVLVQDNNPTVASDVANRLVANFIAQVKQIQQQETQLPNARSADNLVVVSPAVAPDIPVGPHRTLNVAIAFGAGLLFALGIAYLLDYLDQSIKNDEELTGRLGLVAVGHIPFVPPAKGRRAELVAFESQSPSAEAYKALRTSLLFSTIDQELKTVVITSPGPGEGKSRTAANLAVVLAGAGHKTLLIDADFRRPSLHRIFGRIRNVGLTNLILQDVSENEAVGAVEEAPNLWLATSGPIPPNPSELLGSGRLRELMARLKSAFTYIILDTPPINAVTDAAILASIANGTILVVEQGRTTFPALGHAKQLLDRVGAHTIGVVMNKVRASAGSYSYGYGYYGTQSDERDEREARQASESESRVTVRR